MIYKDQYLKLLPRFKEKRTQQFTTVVLTFIFLSILVFFAINPTLSTIAQLNKKLEDNELILEKLNKKTNSLLTLQQAYDSMPEDIQAVLSAVPKFPEAPLLAAQIQGLAVETGVNLARLQISVVEIFSEVPNPQDSTTLYPSFIVSISVVGDKNNTSRFIKTIVRFQRILSVESIAIVGSKSNQNFQVEIRARAYFKK